MSDVRKMGDDELIGKFAEGCDPLLSSVSTSLYKMLERELLSRLEERQLLLMLAKAVDAHYTPLCPECGLRLKDWLDFNQRG